MMGSSLEPRVIPEGHDEFGRPRGQLSPAMIAKPVLALQVLVA